MGNGNPSNGIQVREDLYELRQHGSLDYPVGVYCINLKNVYLGLIRWHWHEEVEYIYVKEGKANFSASDSNYILEAGQGLLINCNTLHSVHPIDDENCVYYSIVFHPSFIFGYGKSILSTTYLLPVMNHPDLRHYVFSGGNKFDDSILNLSKEIIQINEQKNYGYELLTKSLLIQIWLLLLSRLKDLPHNQEIERDAQVATDESRAKDAMTYIAEHYAEALSLQDIADSIHISKSECCRCFKRCIQVTPFEYLLKYRIYSSVNFIVQNEKRLSISEIASQVGFNSSSYFNKLFKKYIGCTPSEYKKTLRQNKDHISEFIGTHIDSRDTLYYADLIHQIEEGPKL